MPLRKQGWILFGIALAFYAAMSVWRITHSFFLIHPDACWYDMVARNLATGRGLTEDCVWYFAIPFATVSHPIGNLFNPLAPIILAGFYRVLGLTEFAGTLPIFLMDGVLAICIFLFSWNRLRSPYVAFFSVLLFTVHRFLITSRGGGGFPESMLMFFQTLSVFAMIRAWEGQQRYYVVAAFFGALAYLTRNEGGLSLAALGLLFLYREIHRPWRAGQRPDAKTWGIGLAAFAVFMAVVLPWEIRNRLLFGDYANAAKYNFFLTREYNDIWSYSRTFSIQEFLAMGPKTILVKILTSYFYKMENFATVTSWPLLMFAPSAFMALRREPWVRPVIFYFLLSFGVMGILNNISQDGGWNGIFVFLPFWIPMSLYGADWFARQVTTDSRRATRLFVVFAVFLFGFHIADNARFLHRARKAGGDIRQMSMQVIGDWLKKNSEPTVTPVPMIHFAYMFSYFTGIPSVKIPTNDPLEKVWEVARKYGCTHVVLAGDVDPVFHPFYTGNAQDPHLEHLVTIPYRIPFESGGDQIKIYRLRLSEPNRPATPLRKGTS